jgi:hypothetical protein
MVKATGCYFGTKNTPTFSLQIAAGDEWVSGRTVAIEIVQDIRSGASGERRMLTLPVDLATGKEARRTFVFDALTRVVES